MLTAIVYFILGIFVGSTIVAFIYYKHVINEHKCSNSNNSTVNVQVRPTQNRSSARCLMNRFKTKDDFYIKDREIHF